MKPDYPAETIRVCQLAKSYGTLRALQSVSLKVDEGETLGILGPNGAGKTTLLEILVGLRRADKGTFAILGHEGPQGVRNARSEIGVILQSMHLPQKLKVRELLLFHSSVYHHAYEVNRALEQVGLGEKADSLIGSLSGGQQRRLQIALAVLPQPRVIIMDEPTSSLDPQARRRIWDLIRSDAADRKRSIIMSTHQMEEAASLCDRVAIIDQGQVVATGTPAELINTYCPTKSVRFKSTPNAEFSRVADLVSESATLKTWRLYGDSISELVARLYAIQTDRRDIIEPEFETATLEDVFLQLTGRRIRD